MLQKQLEGSSSKIWSISLLNTTFYYKSIGKQRKLILRYLSWLFYCTIIIPCYALSQADTTQDTTKFQQKDIKDWLAQRKSKPPKPPSDSNFLLLIPYISSNPTAGFIIGGGLSYTFKTSKTDKQVSLISSNASYSTKKVINLNLKTFAYLFRERLILNGDWRYLVNLETTYGLGTANSNSSSVDINGVPTSVDSLGQPLRFNQLRFYEIGSYKLFSHVFAGLGFQYDRYYNIIDDAFERGDSSSSHYKYSIAHGFDAKEYTVSGFSVNVLYDSRDNQVNAYKGQFANIIYRNNSTGLGSTYNSSTILTDLRCFIPLDKLQSRHILGFWVYGNFILSGNGPYLFLPALGYDQQQRTGRGYRYGRFRGQDMIYGETEYRFPISKQTGILGGVLFLNATTTTDRSKDIMLMEYLKLGYGGGLRIMMDKSSRTRLNIDVGLSHKSFGFYLSALETF